MTPPAWWLSASIQRGCSERSDFLQHLKAHTHHSVTLSVIHAPLWQHEHTLFIHTHTSPRLNTHPSFTHMNRHTLWQIWHPPPVVTFLQPLPPSMGAIPVTVGCARYGKSAKKPPSLPSKLGVVVVCCCANVLRGSLPTLAHGEVQQ